MHKKLNAEVKPELEWFYESSKCAPQQALRDLDNAKKRYLKVPSSGESSPCSLFPAACHAATRRALLSGRKSTAFDHFYLDGAINIKDGFIQLPRIGLVRIHEEVPEEGLRRPG